MYEKTIRFVAPEKYIEKKHLYPEPCKINIPDWFKELKHTPDYKTVKGCMPFLDTLTTGYILKVPTDLYLDHNFIDINDNSEPFANSKLISNIIWNNNQEVNLNIYGKPETHPIQQIGEKCPYAQKNKNLPINKILNPLIIKTAPGYSCLFLSPLNNEDDRFSIVPGIVDTDTFESEVNFPFVCNGDKYPRLKTTIEQGTPYVQVIPFKRESWKMKIEIQGKKDKISTRLFWPGFKIIHVYKNKWWNKKSWK